MLLVRAMEQAASHPLTRLRAETNLSRAALAARVGTSRQTIHRIEAGEQVPSLDLVGRLIKAAREAGGNLSADDFLPTTDGAR